MARPDVLISVDVEADGPIPGDYSMLSFGLAVAGVYDGAEFLATDPAEQTFYAELRPIGDRFDPEALAVSGLDRDLLLREGRDPSEAMTGAAAWVSGVGAELGATPVFVAYPLSYDWMWMYWYFMRYSASGSPFGHSRCLDMKTMYAAKSGAVLSRSTKRYMPKHLLSKRPHTHNALDDAIEQAELCQRLMTWQGRSER
jgi:hypothetical protein